MIARDISLAYSHVNYIKNTTLRAEETSLASSPIPPFHFAWRSRRNYRLDLPKSQLIHRTTGHACFLLRGRGTDSTSTAFLRQKRSINPYQVKLELNLTAARGGHTRVPILAVQRSKKRATISLATPRSQRAAFSISAQLRLEDFAVFSRALSPIETRGGDRSCETNGVRSLDSTSIIPGVNLLINIDAP